ncbi:hypothetical protein B0T18DRAFT_100287 [Schizothecium vesticola]|uniref:Uncharacterized protein n=1 Tax=Schizothecium vesticola TaxID=314040 RepID=A0AA40K8F5_9PEZI|nr:hypothetical protein B0T18DRAFT_100287 [Schizothecium vesticola]
MAVHLRKCIKTPSVSTLSTSLVTVAPPKTQDLHLDRSPKTTGKPLPFHIRPASPRSDAARTSSEAIRNPKMSPVERETRSSDEAPNITSLSPPAGADGTTPTQGSSSSPSNVNGTGTGTGTSGVPNWRESTQRVSTPPLSDTGSMRQNLSNGEPISSRPSSRDSPCGGVEDWLGMVPAVVAEGASNDGARRNSIVMASVAGMGVYGGLVSSGYPQHIDIDEGVQEMSLPRDDSKYGKPNK